MAKFNLEANKHEFDDYKAKAQRILQARLAPLLFYLYYGSL